MKPTIHLIAMHLAYGGVEKAVCAMANLFVEMGYPVKLICTYQMPDAPAYPLDERVEVTYLLKDIPNRNEFKASVASHNPYRILKEGLRSVKILYQKKTRVKKAISRIKEGIVITTRHEDTLVLSKYGAPTVYKIAQLHHDHEFKEMYIDGFKNHYEGIDCFCLLTDQLRDEVKQMMKEGGNEHTCCVTVPNFVDDYPADFKWDRERQGCIAVGRLHPVKGFERMIRLFQSVHEVLPDEELTILGDGEEMENLRMCVQTLGLENHVHLVGAKSAEEVAAYMEKAKLYLMTSYSEGLPFVLIEAQSHGLGAIAYDVRVGPRAVIHEGEDGYLIPDDDQHEFVKKVVEVLSCPKRCEELGRQAFINGKRYTKENVKDIWQKVLEREV